MNGGMIPITYDEPLFRPPGEAGSLLIQLTLGCSHNRCTFCAMYRKKSFGLRSFSEIARDLDSAADYFNHRSEAVRKIFLCDGDALAAPSELLLAVLERANALFPSLRRIGIYAAAQNVLGKSSEELRLFQARKLCLAYIGLESGSDAVLKYVGKGNTAAEASAAVKRLSENNWQTSLIVMLGLGGREHNREHRELTARFYQPNSAAVPFLPYNGGGTGDAISYLRSTRCDYPFKQPRAAGRNATT